VEHKISNVMATVFEIPFEEINDNSSSETIESWDSINHMNLILALEREFGIEFQDDDIAEMLSFSSIKCIIKEKIQQ